MREGLSCRKLSRNEPNVTDHIAVWIAREASGSNPSGSAATPVAAPDRETRAKRSSGTPSAFAAAAPFDLRFRREGARPPFDRERVSDALGRRWESRFRRRRCCWLACLRNEREATAETMPGEQIHERRGGARRRFGDADAEHEQFINAIQICGDRNIERHAHLHGERKVGQPTRAAARQLNRLALLVRKRLCFRRCRVEPDRKVPRNRRAHVLELLLECPDAHGNPAIRQHAGARHKRRLLVLHRDRRELRRRAAGERIEVGRREQLSGPCGAGHGNRRGQFTEGRSGWLFGLRRRFGTPIPDAGVAFGLRQPRIVCGSRDVVGPDTNPEPSGFESRFNRDREQGEDLLSGNGSSSSALVLTVCRS